MISVEFQECKNIIKKYRSSQMLITMVLLTCCRTAVAYLTYPLVTLTGYVPDFIGGVTLNDQIIPFSLHKGVLWYFKVRTPDSCKN